jgi:hypothetical protein
MAYRVVYGEKMPAWERIFPTLREAKAFAKAQRRLGDLVFSIAKVIPGEGPKSLMGAIQENAEKNGEGASRKRF